MSISSQNATSPLNLNIFYSPKFSSTRSHMIKLDKSLLQYLQSQLQSQTQPQSQSQQSQKQIVIEGSQYDSVILPTDKHLYKMKGVNLSTCMLVIDSQGRICQQTRGYLQFYKVNPDFDAVYHVIKDVSCQIKINSWRQLFQQYSFTQYSINKQCFIGNQDFQRLSQAMQLIKIPSDTHTQMKQQSSSTRKQLSSFVYIGLKLSLFIMRDIIKICNQVNKNLGAPISSQILLDNIPMLNQCILQYIVQRYNIEKQLAQNQQCSPPMLKLTAISIMRFIIEELSLAKKQYASYTFDDMLDQLLLLYMPIEYQYVTASWLKDSRDDKDKGKQAQTSKNKERQTLFSIRHQYFISDGEKYSYYDYMDIHNQISSRIKYLSGFKNRWKLNQLKAIFRGVDCTEEGKYCSLPDVLLKKFRKYGDEYEIKFVLPQK